MKRKLLVSTACLALLAGAPGVTLVQAQDNNDDNASGQIIVEEGDAAAETDAQSGETEDAQAAESEEAAPADETEQAAEEEMEPAGEDAAAAEDAEAPADDGQMASEDAGGTNAGGDMFFVYEEEQQIRSGKLIGSSVTNTADETVGDINDLIVSTEGDFEGVIVGVGGFLGIGEKDVGVRFDALQISEDPETGETVIVLDQPKDALEQAPAFVTKERQKQAEEMQQNAAENAAATGTGSTATGTGTGTGMTEEPAGQMDPATDPANEEMPEEETAN